MKLAELIIIVALLGVVVWQRHALRRLGRQLTELRKEQTVERVIQADFFNVPYDGDGYRVEAYLRTPGWNAVCFDIDWNDGSLLQRTTSRTVSHVYAEKGDYTPTVIGYHTDPGPLGPQHYGLVHDDPAEPLDDAARNLGGDPH